jgi:hypothetical protein
MKETERERKTEVSPYIKILAETMRERFNPIDLSDAFFDPSHKSDYVSRPRRGSRLRKSTKALSGVGICRLLA